MALKDINEQTTLREVICRQYALLSAIHACASKGIKTRNRLFYMVYHRSYNDYMSGKKQITSLVRDEKEKILQPRCCVYCGSMETLSIDHLFPRKRGGEDIAENLVLACRKCNSSKNDGDMVTWYRSRGQEVPLLLYRRYLKLVVKVLQEENLLDEKAFSVQKDLPFDLDNLYRNDNISVANAMIFTAPMME